LSSSQLKVNRKHNDKYPCPYRPLLLVTYEATMATMVTMPSPKGSFWWFINTATTYARSKGLGPILEKGPNQANRMTRTTWIYLEFNIISHGDGEKTTPQEFDCILNLIVCVSSQGQASFFFTSSETTQPN